MSDEVLIKLGVDGSTVARGLRAVDPIISAWGDKVSGLIGKAFTPLAIGGAAAGLAAWGKSMLSYATELEHMSENTGVSTDTLQYFGKAAKRAGADVDTAQTALAKLSAKVGEARSGNAEATASFTKWGIALVDAGGKAKSVDQIIAEVAKRNSELGDAALEAAMRMDLFGKAGVKMGAVLETFNKMSKDPNKILTEGDIAKLHDAEQTLIRLTNHSKVFGGKMLAAFATFFGLADPNAAITAGLKKIDEKNATAAANAAPDPKQALEYIAAANDLAKAQADIKYKSANDEGKLTILNQRQLDLRTALHNVDSGSIDALKIRKQMAETETQQSELILNLAKKRTEAEKQTADKLAEQKRLRGELGNAQHTLAEQKEKQRLAGNVNPTIEELAGSGQWWGGPDYHQQALNALQHGPYRQMAQRAQYLKADELAARGLGNFDRADADKAERLGITKKLGDLGVTAPDESLRSIDDAVTKTEQHIAELNDLLKKGALTVTPVNGK